MRLRATDIVANRKRTFDLIRADHPFVQLIGLFPRLRIGDPDRHSDSAVRHLAGLRIDDDAQVSAGVGAASKSMVPAAAIRARLRRLPAFYAIRNPGAFVQTVCQRDDWGREHRCQRVLVYRWERRRLSPSGTRLPPPSSGDASRPKASAVVRPEPSPSR